MFIRNLKFKVKFSSYSKNHFCKSFLRKYKKKAWNETIKTIHDTFEKIFGIQKAKLIDIINFNQEEEAGIFKLDFSVAGTQTSRKSSGNRLIFFLSNKEEKIEVLLVYGKGNCPKGQHETQWILEEIKSNFPEYKKIIGK